MSPRALTPDVVQSRSAQRVFERVATLTSISLPNSLKYIGNGAFMYTGLRNLIIPDSVTYLGPYLCYKCTSLHSVVIGMASTCNTDLLMTQRGSHATQLCISPFGIPCLALTANVICIHTM